MISLLRTPHPARLVAAPLLPLLSLIFAFPVSLIVAAVLSYLALRLVMPIPVEVYTTHLYYRGKKVYTYRVLYTDYSFVYRPDYEHSIVLNNELWKKIVGVYKKGGMVYLLVPEEEKIDVGAHKLYVAKSAVPSGLRRLYKASEKIRLQVLAASASATFISLLAALYSLNAVATLLASGAISYFVYRTKGIYVSNTLSDVEFLTSFNAVQWNVRIKTVTQYPYEFFLLQSPFDISAQIKRKAGFAAYLSQFLENPFYYIRATTMSQVVQQRFVNAYGDMSVVAYIAVPPEVKSYGPYEARSMVSVAYTWMTHLAFFAPYLFASASRAGAVYVGDTLHGDRYFVDISTLEPPHILIAGMTGTGKTWTAAALAANIAYAYGARIVAIDPQGNIPLGRYGIAATEVDLGTCRPEFVVSTDTLSQLERFLLASGLISDYEVNQFRSMAVKVLEEAGRPLELGEFVDEVEKREDYFSRLFLGALRVVAPPGLPICRVDARDVKYVLRGRVTADAVARMLMALFSEIQRQAREVSDVVAQGLSIERPRLVVVADEAHYLLKRSEYLEELWATVRKYGVVLVAVTQDLLTFTQPILRNSAYALLFHPGRSEDAIVKISYMMSIPAEALKLPMLAPDYYRDRRCFLLVDIRRGEPLLLCRAA